MGPRTVLSIAALSGLAALLTGCSSSSPASGVTSSSAASATKAASPAPTAVAAPGQSASVLPASGLRDGQTVVVTAEGFGPGRSLIAVQCADKGRATGPGDCDLEKIAPAAADAQGHVRVSLTVRKGPFGANRVICGGVQKCLVSVADAAQPPQEQAAAPVAFG
jgi:hypothetical protein